MPTPTMYTVQNAIAYEELLKNPNFTPKDYVMYYETIGNIVDTTPHVTQISDLQAKYGASNIRVFEHYNENGTVTVDYYFVDELARQKSVDTIEAMKSNTTNTKATPNSYTKMKPVEDGEGKYYLEGADQNGTGKLGMAKAVNVPTALSVTCMAMALGDRIGTRWYEENPDGVPQIIAGNQEFKNFLQTEYGESKKRLFHDTEYLYTRPMSPDRLTEYNTLSEYTMQKDGKQVANLYNVNGVLMYDPEEGEQIYLQAEDFGKLAKLTVGTLGFVNPNNKKYEDLTIPVESSFKQVYESRSESNHYTRTATCPNGNVKFIGVREDIQDPSLARIQIFAVSKVPVENTTLHYVGITWEGVEEEWDNGLRVTQPISYNGETCYYQGIFNISQNPVVKNNTIPCVMPYRSSGSVANPTGQEVIGAFYGEKILPIGITEDDPNDEHISDETLKALLDDTSTLGAILPMLENDLSYLADHKIQIPTTVRDSEGNYSIEDVDYYPLSLPTDRAVDLGINAGNLYSTFITDNGAQQFDNTRSLEDILTMLNLAPYMTDIPFPDPIKYPEDMEVPEPDPTPEDNPTPRPDPWQVVIPNIGIVYPDPHNDGDTEENKPPIATTGNTGLGGIYNPTSAELGAINSFLWSSDFWDIIEKMINNPMDAIIGLQEIYYSPTVSASKEHVYCGCQDTHVSSYKVTKRFYELDCGEVAISEKFYNAYDYQSEISIYLPYIGIVPLDTSVVMNSILNVVYTLDVCSGSGICNIYVTRDGFKTCMYTYGCQVSSVYPLSGRDFTGLVGSLTSLAGSIITGNTIGVGASLISGVSNMNGSVQKSGGYGGNTGALGIKKPYVIITRPVPCRPSDFTQYLGNPTNYTARLGTVRGYTNCGEVRLNTEGMTEYEINYITNALRSGVIL